MDGNKYVTYSYKLRSAGAVPVKTGVFLVQAFGGDRNQVVTYEATTTLPVSDNFMGASIVGPYMQASFQRLPYLTRDGKQIFSGTTVGRTQFIDESAIPGQGAF